jgi:hypothetical protein
LALWGHEGKAPTSIRIRIMRMIVPSDMRFPFLAHRGKRLQTGGLESRFKAGITRVFEIL